MSQTITLSITMLMNLAVGKGVGRKAVSACTSWVMEP